MANDIYCVMEVECGTEKKANKIVDLAESDDEDFDFNKLIPLEENDDPVEKWGTKWFKLTGCVLIDDTKLECSATTAWNAPYNFVNAFCKKYKVSVKMLYYDCDNFGANCGCYEVDEDGDVEEDEYYGERSSESLKFLERMCGEEELEFMGFEKDETGEWHFEDEDEE